MSRERITLNIAAVSLAAFLAVTALPLIWPSTVEFSGRQQILLLLLFSLSHASYLLGWRNALLFFAVCSIVSWLFEQIGVETGLVYGPYHYSDILGPKIGHVPIAIPVSWFMMAYPSYIIANLLIAGRLTVTEGSISLLILLSVVGAMVMTAWDLAIDPILSGVGMWVWEKGGPYFGVPVHNFGGWLLTTFTIYLLYRLWERHAGIRPFGRATSVIAAMPLLAYGGQMARTFSHPELGLIAFFAMGTPLLVAAYRVIEINHTDSL